MLLFILVAFVVAAWRALEHARDRWGR